MTPLSPIIRKAKPTEFDSIYLMGIDVWSEGSSETEYLEGCRASVKYRKGTWYVLEDESRLLSSLIVYRFEPGVVGMGSIATPVVERCRGHATRLISEVLKMLEAETEEVQIFLYSDIRPEFYEKFGFSRLPEAAQRYQTTVCMIKSHGRSVFLAASQTPEYF
ncbi:MAG: GNAT family N-acetyltransferase [Cryobacterium sp.]|nr:GNAT family N-acetyltransferase [Oligoflexia bacterium]